MAQASYSSALDPRLDARRAAAGLPERPLVLPAGLDTGSTFGPRMNEPASRPIIAGWSHRSVSIHAAAAPLSYPRRGGEGIGITPQPANLRKFAN